MRTIDRPRRAAEPNRDHRDSRPAGATSTPAEANALTPSEGVARWLPPPRGEKAPEASALLPPRSSSNTLSFSELGKQRALSAFDKVVSRLDVLNAKSVPHDPELKLFRKNILTLRDQVDIFAQAYGRGREAKTWKHLRDDLNRGYERVGQFKDLFDSQGLVLSVKDPVTHAISPGVRPEAVEYRDETVAAARKRALAWKESFGRPEALARVRTFLASPAAQPHDIRRKNLSSFFWGGARLTPSRDLSGLENVARLNRAQFSLARTALSKVSRLDDLTKPEEESEFHDLRKRMRSANNIVDQFPDLVADPLAMKAMQEKLVSFITAYGVIEDKLVGFHSSRGPDSGERATEIRSAWGELRERQAAERLDDLLREFEGALQP